MRRAGRLRPRCACGKAVYPNDTSAEAARLRLLGGRAYRPKIGYVLEVYACRHSPETWHLGHRRIVL